MKQRLLGLILILIFIFKSVLVYAQEALFFSAVEGTRPTKIVGEILRRAYQEIGIQIEILELPGKRGLMYSQAGITDGEAFRTRRIEKNHNNLKRINVAVSVDEMYLFVKRGNEFPVKGWESVSKDIIVGYQRGVKFAEKDTAKYEIKTQPVRNPDQLFQILVLGRVEAIIAGKQVARNQQLADSDGTPRLAAGITVSPGQAEYLLAQRYAAGRGLFNQSDNGLGWLHLAAEKGYVQAQFELGTHYFQGSDRERPNYKAATRWWGLARDNNHADAVAALAMIEQRITSGPLAVAMP